MAFYETLKTHFDQTIIAFAFSRRDSVGARHHSTSGTTFPAHQEERFHHVVNVDGQTVVAKGMIFVVETSSGTLPQIDVRDKIQRPDGTVLPLLAVETPISTGTRRLYHQVLHY